ncbi:MAG: type II secretion system protein E, partial [Chloroflexi bacterium]|nr:type II secretion system protein E [Chloroflexota bacterium]
MTTPPHMSGWWGGYGRGEDRLSLLDLIRNGTLDLQMAALLWGLVERKTSIIVAAGPQRAGKTTLLSALVDFMPPWFERVHTRGIHEDFSFLSQTDPSKTCILIPELSDHTPAYLWGIRVQTLFDALARGYSMAAT